MLMILMDWAISQTCSLTLLSIHCVVNPPLSCQITMVSAAHWLIPTPAFSDKTQTCGVGIWNIFESATTDFHNKKALHYIVGSQTWWMIKWWILNACYSEPVLGMLKILSRVMRWSCRAEEGLSKVQEIVSKVGRQGEYIYGLGGFSWSSNNILTAIQRGDDMLGIIYVPWFIDWTLKFISKITISILCSHISFVCPCASSCSPQWARCVSMEGEFTVSVKYERITQWLPSIR